MRKCLKFVATFVSCAIFNSGWAHADTYPLYNDTCQIEVAQFQQSSSDEEEKSARHALLLCLADNAYEADNQKPSDYENWTDTVYFRLFAKSPNVEIADTQSWTPPETHSGWSGSPESSWAIVGADFNRECACPATRTTRTPGDPVSPRKDKGVGLYVMVDVGDAIKGGTESFKIIHDAIDRMRLHMVEPYSAEEQAKELVAQMADPDATKWKGLYSTYQWDWKKSFGSSGVGSVGEQDINVNLFGDTKATTWFQARCGCPRVRIPLDRSPGDSVTPRKHDAPNVFFETDNLDFVNKLLRNNKIFQEKITTHEIQ